MRQTFEEYIAANYPTSAKADISYIRVGWDAREAQLQREIDELVRANASLAMDYVAPPTRDPASRTRAGDIEMAEGFDKNGGLPVEPPPPVDNEFVAEGAEKFADPPIPGSDDLEAPADAAAAAE